MDCYSSHKIILLTKQLQELRHLKIIESQINATFRKRILPTAFFQFCFANVVTTYLCISYRSTLFQHLGHLTFLAMCVESFVGILCLGTLSGMVNKRSKLIQIKLRKHCSKLCKFKDQGVVCKQIMAFAPMKIRFASNFVSILTPLVMMNFCLRLTVRLFLLQ